jgi:isoamylase
VITMEMFGKIRRMYFRDKLSLHEITKRTGLTRNTIRKWLRTPDKAAPPQYRRRGEPGKLKEFYATLEQSLTADSHRPKQNRRTAKDLFVQIKADGYVGGYSQLTVFIRGWLGSEGKKPHAFVPLKFELGEAFQFDWSEEGLVVGGIYRRMQVTSGQLYAYRVDGSYLPEEGHRFNFNKLLLDPFATAITPFSDWDFGPARGYDPSAAEKDLVFSKTDDAGDMPKCVFIHEHFHWHDDLPPRHPWSKTVIYETHVRGFTIHPSAGVEHPGTYRGLMEKIPYLQELGITAVELMPVYEFNENQLIGINPQTGKRLRNYWGYDPVVFFAPKASYSSAGGQGQQTLEFKEMVRTLHKAGIEVILDVVFNHTAEGNELGPTLCFRGIDNAIFYMLASDQRYYKDYTGTGNTFNANHPVVRDHILNALRYWVLEMHVDGFRFDLASVLGRDEAGKLLADAPLLERIAEDPILRDVKIIAEAWDAAGAYEVGSFSERRWAEWNGRYRDDVRRFWRGDDGMLGLFASRICGSADIYTKSGKGPEGSINFVTCHDGFTLNDLVSYRDKHNEANGENNHDGTDTNFSENYGAEGETTDAGIEVLRKVQIKNFLLTLFISRGVPMLLGGDEFRRTQGGNNNAYCQDNETSWYDWGCAEQHSEILRFTRGMIAFRRVHPIFSREEFYSDGDTHWFAPQGGLPDWVAPKSKQFACLIREDKQHALFLMFNAGDAAIDFALPAIQPEARWYLAIHTAQKMPRDIFTDGEELLLEDSRIYHLPSRAGAILLAR